MLTLRIPSFPGSVLAVIALLGLQATVLQAATRPIPQIVNVKIFATDEANQLEVFLRLPLAAVQDVQFPTRADGDSLDLVALQTMLPGAAQYWVAGTLTVADDGVALPAPQVADTRISISADRSFDAYESAQMHFGSPRLAITEEVYWRQVWFDIRLLYPLPADSTHRIAIESKLSDLGVRVTGELTHVRDKHAQQRYIFDGDLKKIYLDPRVSDTGKQFVLWGARRVLAGPEFLLILLCLTLPFRRHREFLPSAITFLGAFVAAIAASPMLPSSVALTILIETFATLAILLAAFANIAGKVTLRRRALLSLAAGAVFGLLATVSLSADLQYAADHTVVGSFAYTIGAALMMSVVAATLIPVTTALFSFARVEKIERIIISALIADTVWRWFSDYASQLAQISYQFEWHRALLGATLKWLALLLVVFGLVWLINIWLKSFCNEAELTKTGMDKTGLRETGSGAANANEPIA